uniref:GAG-pre-integrase domain-containing protein n=1 Tax=Tanacetum cinerariifolium TaxID=118510 RepID=A0A6L2NFF6_TANCI|nr:hypothetical protein [Tanacetum cinerariifolium]
MFIVIVRFGNDRFGAIMVYGDYVISDSVISRVYYAEGLAHNIFPIGQYGDLDLEVAFRKHSCYVRDEDGVDLLKCSPSKNKSWLWNHWLNHFNIGTINDLARKDLVRGLPRLKFEKDHLFSACQLGKNNGTKFVNQAMTEFYESIGITHQKSVSRTPQQNNAKAIAIACYTQNRFVIHSHHIKTPYELVHGIAPGPTFEDNLFAQAHNDPFVNPFAPDPSSKESSSGDISSAKSKLVIYQHDHLRK